MHTTNTAALKLVHRLLFRALIEIRAQGHEEKNKLVFHLADLFHNAILDLEAAAEGRLNYEEVFRQLEEKAKEKHCERWLRAALTEIEANQPPNSGASREAVAAEEAGVEGSPAAGVGGGVADAPRREPLRRGRGIGVAGPVSPVCAGIVWQVQDQDVNSEGYIDRRSANGSVRVVVGAVCFCPTTRIR